MDLVKQIASLGNELESLKTVQAEPTEKARALPPTSANNGEEVAGCRRMADKCLFVTFGSIAITSRPLGRVWVRAEEVRKMLALSPNGADQ